jgi:hypothetical protein
LRRMGGWLAAPAVLVAAVALVGSGLILERASAYMNFQAQKASYDATVARAGPGPHLFLWQESPRLLVGVVYYERGCEPPAREPPARVGVRRPLEGRYCFVSEPRR